jgi:hypothetical protein
MLLLSPPAPRLSSVTESVALPPDPGLSIVPQANPTVAEPPLYSATELVEKRRSILRYARSFPPGTERNYHRQIAWSLRALFRNAAWLAAHTVKD